MPLLREKLDDAVPKYIMHRQARGLKPRTIDNDRQILRNLRKVIGNINVCDITDEHIDVYMVFVAENRPRSSHIDIAVLRKFFGWARKTGRYPKGEDPMWEREALPVPERIMPRVPRRDFARLLDAAEADHPRNRMIVALGLYLCLRQSEMKLLQIRDVRLLDARLYTDIVKTNKVDMAPISAELDRELRRWLTWYTNEVGELKPDYYLIPRRGEVGITRVKGRFVSAPDDPSARLGVIYPDQDTQRIERPIQVALRAIGFDTHDDETGKSLLTGEHTLRRSGARAICEALAPRIGIHEAKEVVRALLHHVRMEQTEHYIGWDLYREIRDSVIAGQELFPTVPTNVVVPIRSGVGM